MQIHMTSCFDICEKERLWKSFAASLIDAAKPEESQRKARGKPETPDETCGSIKTSVACETSLKFVSFKSNVLMSCDLKIDVS